MVGPAAGALERRRPAAPDEFAARRADRVTRHARQERSCVKKLHQAQEIQRPGG